MPPFARPARSLALVLALALAGCSSLSAAPAGQRLSTEAAFTVEPNTAWTRVSKGASGTQGSVLTQDGTGLNAVHLVTVPAGKALARTSGEEMPRYVEGSSELAMVEFVTNSLSRLGYEALETSDVRPGTLGGLEGVRFGLAGRYPSGLRMRGDVALAESDDGLNMVAFIAPASHYFARDLAEAEAVINSVRF